MFLTQIDSFILDTALLNNLLLMVFFIAFFILFFKANNDDKIVLTWIDLLVDQKTNKLSIAKLGQFWGVAISSWVVISMSQIKESYTIFSSVFAAYLAFLGGTWSFNQFLKSKNTTDEVKENNG